MGKYTWRTKGDLKEVVHVEGVAEPFSVTSIATTDSAEKADFICKACNHFNEYEDWISVNERLPEQYSFVMATVRTDNGTWVEIAGFGISSFFLPGRGTSSSITHWKPIPNPAPF